MQIYDTNKNKLVHTFPAYYRGKMWGDNPIIANLVDSGLIPYIKPIYDPVLQKLGEIQINGDECTHNVINLTDSEKLELYERTIPDEISIRQANLILKRNGLLQTIIDKVYEIGGEAIIEWEKTSSIKRYNPLVDQVATSAGMTKEQIDKMFIDGAKIPV